MTQTNESTRTELQSATTETKSRGRRARRAAAAAGNQGATALHRVAETAETAATHGVSHMNTQATSTDILNSRTFGKFVLFGIPQGDRVKGGPVMRGLVEVKTEAQGAPVKVQVAAWLKIGRSSGTEYLSLKVGNNDPEDPETYTVGPFYGRLFRQVEGTRVRYFGFIEEAEKTGADENGQGTYVTHWQLRITAKAAVSHDQKTQYISGRVSPSQMNEQEEESSALPF
jgi:biotin carboxyl carrier protein